jgi:hypothetical protein
MQCCGSEPEHCVLFVATDKAYAPVLNAVQQFDEFFRRESAPKSDYRSRAAIALENYGRSRAEICGDMSRITARREADVQLVIVSPRDDRFSGRGLVRKHHFL